MTDKEIKWENYGDWEQGLKRIKEYSDERNCSSCNSKLKMLLLCFEELTKQNKYSFVWEGECSDCGLCWNFKRNKN